MKAKLIGLVLAATSAFAYANVAGPGLKGQQLIADSLSVDEAREEARASGLQLRIGEHLTLKAVSATFRFDSAKIPRVVDVEGVRIESANGLLLATDEATYYPELRVMTASRATVPGFSLDSSQRGLDSGMLSNDPPDFICHNGTLYYGETPVSGNSACPVNGFGGSMIISCSASGNQLKFELRDQGCPIET